MDYYDNEHEKPDMSPTDILLISIIGFLAGFILLLKYCV